MMTYKIRKLINKDLYQVRNIKTGEIHSKHSTLQDAKKQDHGRNVEIRIT